MNHHAADVGAVPGQVTITWDAPPEHPWPDLHELSVAAVLSPPLPPERGLEPKVRIDTKTPKTPLMDLEMPAPVARVLADLLLRAADLSEQTVTLSQRNPGDHPAWCRQCTLAQWAGREKHIGGVQHNSMDLFGNVELFRDDLVDLVDGVPTVTRGPVQLTLGLDSLCGVDLDLARMVATDMLAAVSVAVRGVGAP